MQYCMYLRKSRADLESESRGEGETLARHKKMLYDLAKKQNINVTKIYQEIVSGETIASRPVMQKMLEEVEQGLWSGVLVVEIERLARGDTIDQGIVAQAFKYTNTMIITPVKKYDPSNEFDEEYFEFGLFMSRREYKTINRRIQRGRIASVKEGKYICSVAPYGYNRVKIKNDKGYTLEINDEQAKAVKMIYNWYTVGELQLSGKYEKLGPTRIARRLDSIGIKPLRNGMWSRASIQDILKNPVYIGKIRWQYRKEIKQVLNGTVTKARPKADEYILVDGIHEPIIAEDIFNLVQRTMAKRGLPPVPGKTVLKNPLSGLILCGKCGSIMTRLAKTTKTPYDTLKCPNRYCDNISSPLYLIERELVNNLSVWIKNYKLNLNTDEIDQSYTETICEKEDVLKQLHLQLDKLDKQIEKTYTFLEQGIYSTDIFMDRRKKITSQAESIKVIISETENELQILYKQINQSKNYIPKVERTLEIYNKLDTASTKNELLKEVVDRVEYLKTIPNKKGNRDNCNFILDVHPKVLEL